MALHSTSPELQSFLSEAVAPSEPVLAREGFQFTVAQHVGTDGKTGMPICFSVFSSPTLRVQISHTDGGLSIHVGEASAPLCLAQPTEWKNIRALKSTSEASIEELLKRVPSRPLTMAEQGVGIALLLQQSITSFIHAR